MTQAGEERIRTRDDRGGCRRGFFRVTTWVPIRITRLTAESAARFEREFDAPAEESATLEDGVLEARLGQIERKLDLLLERAGFQVEAPLSRHEKREVELSGSGLRVEVPGFLRRGDLARVELELPEQRGRSIRLLGRIVSGNDGSARDARRGVALAYQAIRDRDREAIVRHAYEVQRLSLGRASRRGNLR